MYQKQSVSYGNNKNDDSVFKSQLTVQELLTSYQNLDKKVLQFTSQQHKITSSQ